MMNTHKHLEGEHPLWDLIQLIILFVFLLVWVFDSFVFKISIVLSRFVPIYIRIILSVLVLILSFILIQKSHKIIFHNHSKQDEKIKLHTTGVYSKVRHPMYLGSLLFYLSLIISTMSLIAFVLWIGIFFIYNYFALYEEKFLINKFGKEYLDYIKKVPRWILKL